MPEPLPKAHYTWELKSFMFTTPIQILLKSQLRYHVFFCLKDKWLKVTNKYLRIPFHHET